MPRKPFSESAPPPRAHRQWTQAFARQFPSWLRERGDEYFARGAVALDSVSDRQVRATVSGNEPYTVELRQQPRGLALSCSCPYYRRNAGACKHLWAVLLAAEDDGRFVPSHAGGRATLGDDFAFDEADLDPDAPAHRADRRPYGRAA